MWDNLWPVGHYSGTVVAVGVVPELCIDLEAKVEELNELDDDSSLEN